MTDSPTHRAEAFESRYFYPVIEIWCPNIDETKGILGYDYVRHCPMCGEVLDDPPTRAPLPSQKELRDVPEGEIDG